jgi:hypothetical protein
LEYDRKRNESRCYSSVIDFLQRVSWCLKSTSILLSNMLKQFSDILKYPKKFVSSSISSLYRVSCTYFRFLTSRCSSSSSRIIAIAANSMSVNFVISKITDLELLKRYW